MTLKDIVERLRRRSMSESMSKYEEERKRMDDILSKPHITLHIEIPEGFEDMRGEFMELEDDKEFLSAVENLVKKTLLARRRKATD